MVQDAASDVDGGEGAGGASADDDPEPAARSAPDPDDAGNASPAVDDEALVPGVDYPVLLFDGVCNLCTGSVRFVIERDPEGQFKFAPLQSDVADDVLAGHEVDPADLDTVVLVEDGETFTKSAAALRVARRLAGPWSLAWSLRVVPRVVRDAVYDLVVATRYDVFGRKDSCMVPTPEIRDRFLETTD